MGTRSETRRDADAIVSVMHLDAADRTAVSFLGKVADLLAEAVCAGVRQLRDHLEAGDLEGVSWRTPCVELHVPIDGRYLAWNTPDGGPILKEGYRDILAGPSLCATGAACDAYYREDYGTILLGLRSLLCGDYPGHLPADNASGSMQPEISLSRIYRVRMGPSAITRKVERRWRSAPVRPQVFAALMRATREFPPLAGRRQAEGLGDRVAKVLGTARAMVAILPVRWDSGQRSAYFPVYLGIGGLPRQTARKSTSISAWPREDRAAFWDRMLTGWDRRSIGCSFRALHTLRFVTGSEAKVPQGRRWILSVVEVLDDDENQYMRDMAQVSLSNGRRMLRMEVLQPATDGAPKKELSAAPQTALQQYRQAKEDLGDCTDRQAYDWLAERASREDDRLHKFASWQRTLRRARRATGTQKKKPKLTPETGKSIVRSDQI